MAMKAWRIAKHGGNDVLDLTSLEVPNPGEGEVRVRVRAVGLNHLDLWVRNGVPGHSFPLPITPGCDIVAETESGERVLVNPVLSCGQCAACEAGRLAICSQFGIKGETTNGGLAEWAVVPKKSLIPLSEKISDEEAACLPIAYVTAWNMLTDKAKLKKGERILVHAGGSGVSVAAIQMAKHLGAEVLTTVSSKEKAERVRELGANSVILYKEGPFRKQLKLHGGRVDVVIDHVGVDTFGESLKSLNWGGRLVTCGATTGSEVQMDLKLVFFKSLSILGSTMGSHEDLLKVLELVESKKIRAVIDEVFPFDSLPRAFQKLEERRVFGKVVIKL